MTMVFRLTRFLEPANGTEFNKSVDNRRPGVPHLRKSIVRACAYYRKTKDPAIRYSYVILLIPCGSFDFHSAIPSCLWNTRFFTEAIPGKWMRLKFYPFDLYIKELLNKEKWVRNIEFIRSMRRDKKDLSIHGVLHPRRYFSHGTNA